MTGRSRPPPFDERRFQAAQEEFAQKSTPPIKELTRHVEALINTTSSIAEPASSATPRRDAQEKNLVTPRSKDDIDAINLALSQLSKHLSEYANAIKSLPVDTPTLPTETRKKLTEAAQQIEQIRSECKRQKSALDETAGKQSLLAETTAHSLGTAKAIADQISIAKEDILAKRSEAGVAIETIHEEASKLAAAARQANIETESISSASRVANEANDRIQKVEKEILEKLKGLREVVVNGEQVVTERKSDFEKLLQSLRQHEETLKAKIQTAPAMRFWDDKLKEHIDLEHRLRRALLWFAALAGFSLVALCAIFYSSGILLTGIPLWATVALGGFSISFVWAGRLLVRLFLEQAALKEDAKERCVFAESYLSFVEQKMVEKEHVAIILQALFRHARSGGGTDDSSPTLPQEVLIKTFTGSK